MSKRRPAGRRRQPVPKLRDRREVVIAVAASAAVVVGTLLLIWLLRPGPPGTEGTGGLMNRQPRASWLVGLTLAAAAGFTWWALRRQRDWRGKFIIVFLGGWLVIGLAAVVAGILWPGGLLRHTTPPPTFDLENLLPSSTVAGDDTTVPTVEPGGGTAPTIPMPTFVDQTVP